jgi:hypothetical protein
MPNHFYYLDTSSLSTATRVWADMRGSIAAPAAYYSNGTIWRFWNGSRFTNQGNCNSATPAPTPAPTAPPTPPPTSAPVTPAPVTAAPTPPPTPAPTDPTPPPTPAPITSPPTNPPTPPPTPAPITSPPTNPPTPPPTAPPTPAPVDPTPAPVVTSYEWGITMAEGEGDGSSGVACSNTLGFDDVYTAESSLTTATTLFTDPNLQYTFDGTPNNEGFGDWFGLGDVNDTDPSYAFRINSGGNMTNRTSCSTPAPTASPTPAPVDPTPSPTPAPVVPTPSPTPAPVVTPPPTPAPVDPTPSPTPAPVTAAPTASPTPAPVSSTPCYRVQLTKNYGASYMVYAYTCCNGTYTSTSSYSSEVYVCAQNGNVNMYTGGSYSNLYISCTGC